jgi:hypothetical protein
MRQFHQPHHDYVTAKPEQRWLGTTLRALFPTLSKELANDADGGPVWRVLRGGAIVSLERAAGSRTRILRIHRNHPPVTAYGAESFQNEARTFARAMMVGQWHREPDDSARGIGVMFIEP